MRVIGRLVVLLVAVFGSAGGLQAAELRMAVTTSFHNSGLSDVLLPQISADLGLEVRLVVVGTGQALKLGRAGDVDAILVHSKKAEREFIDQGYGTHRREIMYNDFVVIGPSSDPASVSDASSAKGVFEKIAKAKSIFVSRGDDSGTHRKELALWATAGRDPGSFNASWYRAVGAGMGATLNAASGMNAYLLSDRASWLKFKNKGDLKLLFNGDPVLFNQYTYLPVNPAKHPHVKTDLARKLEDWLVSPKAQALIGSYKISDQALFTPNAE